MRFIPQGRVWPASGYSPSHGHRKNVAVSSETACEDDEEYQVELMPGNLLTMMPFPNCVARLW